MVLKRKYILTLVLSIVSLLVPLFLRVIKPPINNHYLADFTFILFWIYLISIISNVILITIYIIKKKYNYSLVLFLSFVFLLIAIYLDYHIFMEISGAM